MDFENNLERNGINVTIRKERGSDIEWSLWTIAAAGMCQPKKEKRMKIYAMTDVGRKREVNQDYVFATDQKIGPFPNLLVVADGMGGHKAGDFASKYTVEVLKEELMASEEGKPEQILKKCIDTANRKLIEAASSDIKLEGMEQLW